jgi:two-component system, cell cycle sensor histidine kinase and response regulator CckA
MKRGEEMKPAGQVSRATRSELLAEIVELRRRLEDVEAVLGAIQRGEADALVLSPVDGEGLVTLQGAETAFQALLEATNEGAVTVLDDLTILYCNEWFVRTCGEPLDALLGSNLARLLAEADAERLRDAVTESGAKGTRTELTLRPPSGDAVPVQVSMLRVTQDGVQAIGLLFTDLTAVRAAIENGLRLAAIVDSSTGAIFSKSTDGVIVSWNAGAERLYGYSAAEAIGEHVGIIVPDEHRDELDWILEEVRRGRSVVGLETVRQRKDGARIDVELTTSPIRDADGAVTAAAVIGHDIASRKRAETALVRSGQEFRAAFATASIGMAQADPITGRWLRVNQKMCAITGYSAEEMLTMRVPDITYPEDRQTDWEAFQRVVRDEAPSYRMEKRYIRKDGAVIWVNVNMTVIRDEDGQPIRTMAAIEDITERKTAEEAVHESEERFRALIQHASDVVVLLQPEGTISYVSPSISSMLGHQPEDVVGRSVLDFIHPDDWPAVLETIQKVVVAPEATARVECRMRHSDGSWRAIESAGTNQLDNPAVRALVINSRDVSERRTAEEQLRQTHKMEAVGNLAGGIAHDFNNLLQAMLSQTQVLRGQPNDPGEVVAACDELADAISRGASLTRQLLLFARRETVRPERIDLNEAVRDASKLLHRLIRENIAVTINLAEQGLPLDADRGQLQQVLINLALNAADAMPEGGRLVIRTGAGDAHQVWLSLSDSGHGIPEAIREHVFEPFFTTKDAGKGTGLGLSVVQGIVIQHGGRIEVESTVGAGTTFTITLPGAEAGADVAAEEAPIPVLGRVSGAGERILVVEDEEGAREGLLSILTSLGYDVVALGSAEDAGELPAEEPFDVLLTDLMLPGATGPQLARGLLERWPALRVILMSGYAEDEAVRSGVGGGTVRFLQKPFGVDALSREVRAALDEPRGAGEA